MKVFLFISILMFIQSVFSMNYDCEKLFKDEVAHRICYMSLNNPQERVRLQEIFDESGIKVELIELLDPGEVPSDSIKKNLSELEGCSRKIEQKVCDTMVVSGHHDGQFRGDLVDGPLSPEKLLRMSCDHPGIFQGIKSLYLQACNSMDEDTSNVPSELSVQEDERRQIEELERDIDHESLPLGRDNPDYENTNVLRSAFPNANTQGWGIIAPSTGSMSENSMPIDILVRADFERWVREEKQVESSKDLTSSMLASSFNEYLQIHYHRFTYSPIKSSRSDTLGELKDYIEGLDTLVNADPLQCIWDYYQRKYYYSDDKEGVDQRQARSLPSANQSGLPSFCKKNGAGEKIKHVEDFLDGKKKELPPNLNELFEDEQLQTSVPVLLDILEKRQGGDRAKKLQETLSNSPQLKKYLSNQRKNCLEKCMDELNEVTSCQRKCLSSSSLLKDDYQRKVLLGEDISVKKAKMHCSDFKKLYQEIANTSQRDREENSSSPSCLKDVLENFCPQSYIESSRKMLAKLFYQGEQQVVSNLEASVLEENYETFIYQVQWCLAESNGGYQYNRLNTSSCKVRSFNSISKNCARSSSCIAKNLEESIPDCLKTLSEKIAYDCRVQINPDTKLINKQSELVNNYHMLDRSGFLDKKNLIFKIKECENLLPQDALDKLPQIASLGIQSISRGNLESGNIPIAIKDQAKESVERAKKVDLNKVIAECREHERRIRKIDETRAKLEKNDEWAQRELDTIYGQEKQRLDSMLESITKEQWQEVLGSRNSRGELGPSMKCLITGLGESQGNGQGSIVPKPLIMALSCAKQAKHGLELGKECCKTELLCLENLNSIRRQIHPFCKKIYKADGETEQHFSETICRQEAENLERLFDEISGGGANHLPPNQNDSIGQSSGGASSSKPQISNNGEQPPAVLRSDSGSNPSAEPNNTIANISSQQGTGTNVDLIPRSSSFNEGDSFVPNCQSYDGKSIRDENIWKRSCCFDSITPESLVNKYCKTKNKCIPVIEIEAVEENVVGAEDRLRLREKSCCYKMPGIRESKLGPRYELARGVTVSKYIIFDTETKYVSPSYRHLSNDVNDWLRMSIDWGESINSMDDYLIQSSCNEYFERDKKRYKKFLSFTNPTLYKTKDAVIYDGEGDRPGHKDRRDFKELNGEIWYFPREEQFFYETMCYPDNEVMSYYTICNEAGMSKSKVKCESNKACVFVPSRFYRNLKP